MLVYKLLISKTNC